MAKPRFKAAYWMLGGLTAAGFCVGLAFGHEKAHDGSAQSETAYWAAPADAAARKSPVPADPASIGRGRALYVKHCAGCHGDNGQGDGPAAANMTPAPTDFAKTAGHHPNGDIAWKIEIGRGPMPGWGDRLTDTQIWDLTNYVQSLGDQ